jgi:ethanolamine utilization microcompartment shell protein EutS
MKRTVLLLFAVLLTLTFADSALAKFKPQNQLRFKLRLSNAQVIPPLGSFSVMTGKATITFDWAMRSARVSMKIFDNFSGVTAIHLHLGEAGAGDGVSDIVVTVEDLDPPFMDRTFTVLEVFTNERVETVDSVNNIASLYQAVRDGRVYLDVHTDDMNFPNGEIRGQIFPAR